jgi:hypothetical protein
MTVLVDYDNVDALDRNKGVEYVVTRLVTNIGAQELAAVPRLRVRLYGGWYEGRVRTNRAHRLIADVAAAFPKPVVVTTNAVTATVIVGVEVVSSLEIDPSFEFFQTFRRRGESGPLDCLPPPFRACALPSSCHLEGLRRAVNSGACPNLSCAVQLVDVLSRPQQKLVDILLTADLIQFAACSTSWIAIASCDDDLWPGIRTAITFGHPLIHLQTKTAWRPSSTYIPTAALYSYRLY